MGTGLDFEVAMQLSLIIQNIKDEMIRENFYRLLQWIGVQPLLNADFKFFEIDIATATTKFQVSHGLGFVPQDIILLSAIGDQNFYFIYQSFDKKYLYISAPGPVRIRFLAGNYQAPGQGATAVEYPFVAPT